MKTTQTFSLFALVGFLFLSSLAFLFLWLVAPSILAYVAMPILAMGFVIGGILAWHIWSFGRAKIFQEVAKGNLTQAEANKADADAQRRKAQADSERIKISETGEAYLIQSTNQKQSETLTPLHLLPGRTNGNDGHHSEVVLETYHAYQFYHARRKPAKIHMPGDDNKFNQGEKIRKALIPVISRHDCVCIFGPRGSGKSTLALHWMMSRSSSTYYVADISPEGEHGWPSNAIVSGAGANYKEIYEMILAVWSELHSRMEEGRTRAKGNAGPSLTLFLDELHITKNAIERDHDKSFLNMFWEVVSVGRKYDIHGALSTSDKGVESLGLKGQHGLRDALTIVRLAGYEGQEHKAYVEENVNGKYIEVEYTPPQPSDLLPFPSPPQLPAAIPVTKEDKIEQAIRGNPGASFGKVSKLAKLEGSAPTRNALIRSVIEKQSLESFEIGHKTPNPKAIKPHKIA